MKKRIWNIIEEVKVKKRVDFGKEVSLEEAETLWIEDSHTDIIDEEEIENLNFEFEVK